ncbi:MAG: hypothetical protein Q9164_004437, partial [Protoblastenia rupestris]
MKESLLRKDTSPTYLQDSPLARNLQVSPAYDGKGRELMFANMRRYLVDEAWVMMNVLSRSDRVKMDEYLAGRLHRDWHLKSENVQGLQAYWDSLKCDRHTFASKRKQQIQRFTQIFAEHPDMVKRASDPGLEARPNSRHIIAIMQHRVGKYHQDVVKRRAKKRSNYLFRNDIFPIVPLDALLQLFVDTLCKHSVEARLENDQTDGVATMLEGLSVDGPPDKNTDGTVIFCPPSILADIKTVIEGMAYVYTLDRDESTHRFPKILRTKYTPCNDTAHKPTKPPQKPALDRTYLEIKHSNLPKCQRRRARQQARRIEAAIAANANYDDDEDCLPISRNRWKRRNAAIAANSAKNDFHSGYHHGSSGVVGVHDQEPVFMVPPYQHLEAVQAGKIDRVSI